MIKNITILQNRKIIFEDFCGLVGTVGEKNAEIFHINVPKEINGTKYDDVANPSYHWYWQCENLHNGYTEGELTPHRDASMHVDYWMFSFSQEHTVDLNVKFSVSLRRNNNSVIWSSEAVTFYFLPALNFNAESAVRKAIIKLNYDKLFEMLKEQGVIGGEPLDNPTEADVEGLILAARDALQDKGALAGLKISLAETLGDGTFTNHTTFDEIIEHIYEYQNHFGDWSHSVSIDTYPITEYGVSGTASYREAKNDINFILQELANNIWSMVTGLPIPSTRITWQNVKDAIEGFSDRIQQNCADEIAVILNAMLETTEFSGMTWAEIKTAVTGLYDRIKAEVEEEIDNGTY